MQQELTNAEIERMRQILKSHDAQQGPVKTIDLNNPPKVPYQFQAFPKMVYDLEQSIPGNIVCRIVRNEEELADALADGFSKQAPAFGNSPEETLSAKYQSEANQVQEQIEETKKRGPGRPAKVA